MGIPSHDAALADLQRTTKVVSFQPVVHNRTMCRRMQTSPSISIGPAVLALAVVIASGKPASAAICADRNVQARGEASRFEVLAKAKARGNWRAQVRATPTLGPLYANWSIALAADYVCSKGRRLCVLEREGRIRMHGRRARLSGIANFYG